MSDIQEALIQLLPANFREVVAVVAAVMAILYSFVSLPTRLREHGLRLTGLFLLLATVLFAHSAAAYFAAVFIIATAVTQLEFLQNLAAIIRGSKEYFDYKKQFVPPKEVEDKVKKEVEELEAAAPKQKGSEITKFQLTLDKSNLSMPQFGLLCEEYAFRMLERKFERPIQRHVRYSGRGAFVEFDGVMGVDSRDVIFEIKISRRGLFPSSFIMDSVRRMAENVRAYTLLTKREASLMVVLIGRFNQSAREKIREYENRLNTEAKGLNITFQVYGFTEIGLPEFDADTEQAAGGDGKPAPQP